MMVYGLGVGLDVGMVHAPRKKRNLTLCSYVTIYCLKPAMSPIIDSQCFSGPFHIMPELSA